MQEFYDTTIGRLAESYESLLDDVDRVPVDDVTARDLVRVVQALLIGLVVQAKAADDDPHPEWLAEARRLWSLVHAPGFRPGADLARTAEWARFVGLIGLIGSTPARTLPGAVAQLELVAHEWGRSSGGFSGEAADAFAGAPATLRRLASAGTGRGPADGGPEAA